MWMLRKVLLAVCAALACLFLLRASTQSSTSASSPKPELTQKPPNRSYPPPRPKSPPQNQVLVEGAPPKSLRDRLRYQFPYDLEQRFPAYIWQTWKYSPSSGEFGEHLRPLEASWTEMHPGFVHEVVTDEAATHLINYLYASVPEILEAYNALPVAVLKADFFRYLILLARGGIYSDIDTRALKPTTEWLPEDFDRATVGLIIGIEADPDRPDWQEWYSRRIQFCQWTIQSKPGHPVLRDIVATITEDTLRMKEENLLKPGHMPKSIVEFTGPAVWTDTVFSYFNNPTYFDFSARSTNITYSDFFGITEQKRVGDVIVLPITSFSPGVEQMGAKDTNDPMAFVKHDFEGEAILSLDLTAGPLLTLTRELETDK
jgi:alpha 1,6-mannosyltransferase